MKEKKIALITGASRGIGAATAKLFAKQGYSIGLNYKSNIDAAKAVQREILEFGVKCITLKADVSNAIEVKNYFRRSIKNWAR